MTDAELFEIELAAQWASGKKRYVEIIGDTEFFPEGFGQDKVTRRRPCLLLSVSCGLAAQRCAFMSSKKICFAKTAKFEQQRGLCKKSGKILIQTEVEMREEYTMTTDDNGDDRACPFRLASDSTHCSCMGRRCMAWVAQLDDSGKPTGSGRCGMVGVILQMPVTTCASWDGEECESGVTLGFPEEYKATLSDEEKYPLDFPKTIDERGREILHCPNCGSIKVSMQGDLGASYVECEECGMRGPVKRTPEPALQEWNSLSRGVLCCGNKDMEE